VQDAQQSGMRARRGAYSEPRADELAGRGQSYR
jgi:hypothetical protein